MSRARQPILTVLASAALAGAAAAAFLAWRKPAAPVFAAVNSTVAMINILNARHADANEGAGAPHPFARGPMPQTDVAAFFPQIGIERHFTIDPELYFRRKGPHSGWRRLAEYPGGRFRFHTNSLGMREAQEVLPEKPDVRILVAGDSHTAGVVPNAESFVNVVEADLAASRPDETIEVLNAGEGGYSLYNYAGALERYADLGPDVFVACIFGGNDFADAIWLQRYYHRRAAPAMGPLKGRVVHEQLGEQMIKTFLSQEISQVIFFHNNPWDVEIAEALVRDFSDTLERRARELGARLVCVYIPPPLRAQPHVYAKDQTDILRVLEIDSNAIEVSDRLADAWLEYLEERGIPHLDLRPRFRDVEEPLYWAGNLHLNVVANRLVADALQPLLEAVLD
ncbi:MAG: SGNH/GDSL hydrolase family protein [bacterium]|nr:SGNH/GDSL hydrolase family protein [bacterium]